MKSVVELQKSAIFAYFLRPLTKKMLLRKRLLPALIEVLRKCQEMQKCNLQKMSKKLHIAHIDGLLIFFCTSKLMPSCFPFLVLIWQYGWEAKWHHNKRFHLYTRKSILGCHLIATLLKNSKPRKVALMKF